MMLRAIFKTPKGTNLKANVNIAVADSLIMTIENLKYRLDHVAYDGSSEQFEPERALLIYLPFSSALP